MFWVVGHGFPGQLACSERLSVCRRISAPARCRPPASHLKPTFPINLTSSSRQRRTSLQTGGSAVFGLNVANNRSKQELSQEPDSCRGQRADACTECAHFALFTTAPTRAQEQQNHPESVFLGSWRCRAPLRLAAQLRAQRESAEVLLLFASSGGRKQGEGVSVQPQTGGSPPPVRPPDLERRSSCDSPSADSYLLLEAGSSHLTPETFSLCCS